MSYSSTVSVPVPAPGVNGRIAGLCLTVLLWMTITATTAIICDVGSRFVLITIMSTALFWPIAVRAAKGTFDIFEPVQFSSLSLFAMMVTRPLADLSTGTTFHLGYDIMPTFDAALLLVTTGCVFYVLGYASPLANLIASKIPVPADNFHSRFAVRYALSISILGILLYAYFIFTSGGLATLIKINMGRSSDTQIFLNSSGYFYAAPTLLVPASFLIFSAWLKERRTSLLVLALALVSVYALPSVMRGDRSSLIMPMSGIPALWYINQNKRPSLVRVAIVGILVLAFFSILRVTRFTDKRGTNANEVASYTKDPISAAASLFTTDDDEMFDITATALQAVPSQKGFKPFSIITDIGERALPRILVPDKGNGTSMEVLTVLYPNRARRTRGMPATSLITSYYFDSGYVSVIVAMFLSGAVIRSVWIWCQNNRHRFQVVLLYACVPAMVIALFRGTLLDAIGGSFFSVLPLVFFFFLERVLYSKSRAS